MGSKHILVIDDSNTNIVLLESLLERNGYSVSSALSAREGIETIKDKMPDLIYLDLVMPELDGLGFLRILRNNDSWKDIPVVILSAISDSEMIKKSRELGVAEYIIKPLNINKIISLTNNLLSN
ncbi:MAG: response regulator [Bacteroidales bacterium]|nr:response regulator [Bacteroidales bacterium]